MKKIRVGIIGQGRSGRNIHAVAFHNPKMQTMYEIAAVADLIPERCKETCEENPGCKAYTDYKELLKDKSIDLIVNSTYNCDHPRISIEALEAGFNVVCEKPFAYTVADADKVIETSVRTGKFLAVFQEARLLPVFQKIMEIIHSGVIGRVVQANIRGNGFGRRWDWQTLQKYEAGSLSNNGPHALDRALEIMGHTDPDQIFTRLEAVNTFGDADDYVFIVLAKNGGPVVNVEVSSCIAYPNDPFQVYGTLGGITATNSEVKWKYYKPAEAPLQQLTEKPIEGRHYCGEKLEMYEGSWRDPELRSNDWLGCRYYELLYKTLTEGAPFYCTLSQVRRQIAIIETAHKQNPLKKME